MMTQLTVRSVVLLLYTWMMRSRCQHADPKRSSPGVSMKLNGGGQSERAVTSYWGGNILLCPTIQPTKNSISVIVLQCLPTFETYRPSLITDRIMDGSTSNPIPTALYTLVQDKYCTGRYSIIQNSTLVKCLLHKQTSALYRVLGRRRKRLQHQYRW